MTTTKGYELDPDVNVNVDPDKLDSGDIEHEDLIFDVVNPEDIEGDDVEPTEVDDGE